LPTSIYFNVVFTLKCKYASGLDFSASCTSRSCPEFIKLLGADNSSAALICQHWFYLFRSKHPVKGGGTP
jgi:hypothetical protein